MNKSKIALALSGGGVRAMAYHAGLLKHLAEKGHLERVGAISTVSGGSLLVGLIYRLNNYEWPTSNQYLEKVYPQIKNKLCSKSIQASTICRALFNPLNWVFLLSRANIVAKTIQSDWDIQCNLSKIPLYPEWTINGTTAESGRRFRFKNNSLGDYMLGYASPEKLPLSLAMAASAGFPGGIGPLVINSKEYKWFKRESWDAPLDSQVEVQLPYKKIHIYDGGVYDNLGLEPFFDNGRLELKENFKNQPCSLIVSNAGKPYNDNFSSNPLNIFRAAKVIDITMDQAKSLRVRSLMTFFNLKGGNGAYLEIGETSLESYQKYSSPKSNFVAPENEQTKDETIRAANYSTTLGKMNVLDFERIATNGYQAVSGADFAREI